MKRMDFAFPRVPSSVIATLGLALLTLIGAPMVSSSEEVLLELGERDGPWIAVTNVPECAENGRVCAEWPNASGTTWVCCVPPSAIGGTDRGDCIDFLMVSER